MQVCRGRPRLLVEERTDTVPLPDFRVVPGEPLVLDITLTDSADQTRLRLLSINTAQGTLVVAGSAASPIAPGGRFYVEAPGLANRGPFTAATVTPDTSADTTAITFDAHTSSQDIGSGSVEADVANNAFRVTIASDTAIPYVAGGWLRVSGNSTAAANRAYRIWSVVGGPASNQLTVRVEQPLVTPHTSSGSLQVLGNWPVATTVGAVIPASANGFSLEGHTITAQVRDAASTDGNLLATAGIEKIESSSTALELDIIDYYRATPSGFVVRVEESDDLQVGDVVTLDGADTTYIQNGVPYTVTAIIDHLGGLQVWLNGGTSAIPPLVTSGGTMVRVSGSSAASNRYRLTLTAEQTEALAEYETVYLDISHSFTAGALPTTPVRASVTSGGVTFITPVAAGNDHLRIPSSPWQLRIVPAVTAVGA